MWLSRRKFVALTLAGAPSAATAVPAVDLLALRGFDAVSYRLPGGPRAGRAGFEASWRGRVWRFVGEGNRAAFSGDPEAYAPRLGGFDPIGVAEGRLVDADPLAFAIVEGRLYLFRDAERRDRAARAPALVREAELRWPTLRTLMEGVAPE